MKRKDLDTGQLRRLVSYDPETGEFLWLRRSVSDFLCERDSKIWNSRYAGEPAFTTKSNGYLHGRVDGRRYLAHRLAWLFVHGDFPDDEIDHINGDRSDNRLRNLREVSRSENARNLKRFKTNQSGTPGVSRWLKTGRWRANIYCGGKHIHIGSFGSLDEASAARRIAEADLGFHTNHGRTT